MNGFEWRYVAAGLGWGLAVGPVSGLLLAWLLMFFGGPELGVDSASFGEILLAMFWLGLYGTFFGLFPGVVGGTVVGLVLSVLVGRTQEESRAVALTAITAVILTPLLALAGLRVMGWDTFTSVWNSWLWLALALPTVLATLALCWTARGLARRNAELGLRASSPPAPAR